MDVHLVVLCHGLWGTPDNVIALEHAIIAKAEQTGARVVVSRPKGNESTLTYDGIDHCAERVCDVIDAEIADIESKGDHVARFSMAGYSLGGLVARFALGILHSRTPSFFSTIKPVNFALFASPSIGIPIYSGTVWPVISSFFGSRILSRSGAQLYGKDRFFQGRPLLDVLAQPGSSFYEALKSFERVEVYANGIHDRTVPFHTAAISEHDPFAAARMKAMRALKAHAVDLEQDEDPDLAYGGLRISIDQEYPPIIKSYEACEPKKLPQGDVQPAPSFARRLGRRLPKWPAILRPSRYPFRKPVNYIVVFCFPVFVTLAVTVFLTSSIIQTFRSRRRIQGLRKGELASREGRMRRVGLLEKAGDNIRTALSDIVENAGVRDSVGTNTPTKGETQTSGKYALLDAQAESADDLSVDNVDATIDPTFTDAQRRMIKHLNAIPQLKKHVCYFDMSYLTRPHSHGIIVARDGKLNAKGLLVVRHWAEHFVY
ncbi:uncharacterized protein L969DRAFT_452817 [Mixia osmundae IAM 14324]|uniref:DUF676 domain-containing protein n=1 Tax=Mixia osmundae (strain CBS 9802 / IAM 14324 / JCM 22182 / KY 12970) TaxID=764103 RepID=G7E0W8_MIXOS|nr:uncharacterized protein L969DRAFT_452817 [Mixia osmundae IAM 14324]KEI39506.1 hypothetical protein L969DRAFT_452817 [Mixia osmundae IAM 14324]GAA96478.1 hypothetical protein E5Q_03146 [Mixia osmundae IAM 14324]